MDAKELEQKAEYYEKLGYAKIARETREQAAQAHFREGNFNKGNSLTNKIVQEHASIAQDLQRRGYPTNQHEQKIRELQEIRNLQEKQNKNSEKEESLKERCETCNAELDDEGNHTVYDRTYEYFHDEHFQY